MELVIALALTLAIIGLAGRLPDERRVRRELARQRVQSIDTLADGSAAVVRGVVVADGEPLVAPISGRRCVLWLVTFEELGIAADHRELGRAEEARPFLLVSATGTARVVPDRPRFALPAEVVVVPTAHLDDPRIDDPVIRLARSVCKRPHHPRSSSLRVTEYVLEPSTQITVKGFCTREPDPVASEEVTGYRAASPMRPVISGTRDVPLLIG